MYKYVQMKHFHRNRRLQVHMYDFMYVDIQTIPAEDHFTATKIFVVKYKKISTTGTAPKHWLDVVAYVQKIMS